MSSAYVGHFKTDTTFEIDANKFGCASHLYFCKTDLQGVISRSSLGQQCKGVLYFVMH